MPESEASLTIRELLSAQLAIPWSLADTYVLPGLDEVAAHWQPSTNVCAVRPRDNGTWSVDFPDETASPLPDVTAAWLLWHITWWWTNAENWAHCRDALPSSSLPWAGSATAAVSEIRRLHQRWNRLLGEQPMTAKTAAPFSVGQTFEGLASWVNVELTKNIAELGQLARLHRKCPMSDAHRAAPPNVGRAVESSDHLRSNTGSAPTMASWTARNSGGGISGSESLSNHRTSVVSSRSGLGVPPS